jgi:hypothetical protein
VTPDITLKVAASTSMGAINIKAAVVQLRIPANLENRIHTPYIFSLSYLKNALYLFKNLSITTKEILSKHKRILFKLYI